MLVKELIKKKLVFSCPDVAQQCTYMCNDGKCAQAVHRTYLGRQRNEPGILAELEFWQLQKIYVIGLQFSTQEAKAECLYCQMPWLVTGMN